MDRAKCRQARVRHYPRLSERSRGQMRHTPPRAPEGASLLKELTDGHLRCPLISVPYTVPRISPRGGA